VIVQSVVAPVEMVTVPVGVDPPEAPVTVAENSTAFSAP